MDLFSILPGDLLSKKGCRAGVFQFRGEWSSRSPVDRKSHEWPEYREQEGHLLHSQHSFPFAPFVFPQVRPGPGTSRPQTEIEGFRSSAVSSYKRGRFDKKAEVCIAYRQRAERRVGRSG